MARHPSPLPARLNTTFTASSARAAGVASRRLRQPDVLRVARGVYTFVGADPRTGTPRPRARPPVGRWTIGQEPTGHGSTHQGSSAREPVHEHERWRREVVARASVVAPLLHPGEFFSHRTAAALWGLPASPPRRDRNRLDVSRFREHGSARSPLPLRFRRLVPRLVALTRLHGITLTDPATTWAQVAPTLTRDGAVALGDAVLWEPRYPGTTRLNRPALATLEDLSEVAHQRHRLGGPALRALLPLLSTRSASPPETHLRLRLLGWGAPPPTLDHDVLVPDGRLIGCSEIAFPEFKIALEYEGGHHFSQARQYARDIEKYQDYAENGWLVVRVTSQLLYREPDELRRRVFAALALRGWEGMPIDITNR